MERACLWARKRLGPHIPVPGHRLEVLEDVFNAPFWGELLPRTPSPAWVSPNNLIKGGSKDWR
jgi:hypothetical protein